MDLLTLIDICSVAKDVSLVLAMTLTFSGGNVNTVKATKDEAIAEEEVPATATRETATAELKRLGEAGRAPVAGLLPATPAWARMFERPVEDLLDPCAGMGIATAMVSQYEYECEHEHERQGRKGRDCVLHKYAQAVGLDFFADEVRDFIIEQQMPASGAAIALDSEALLQAELLVPGVATRNWGADRIFFPRAEAAKTGGAPAPAAASPRPAAPIPGASKRRAEVTAKEPGTEGRLRLKVAPLPPLSAVSTAAPAALHVHRQ
jgi:hypothetical protein